MITQKLYDKVGEMAHCKNEDLRIFATIILDSFAVLYNESKWSAVKKDNDVQRDYDYLNGINHGLQFNDWELSVSAKEKYCKKAIRILDRIDAEYKYQAFTNKDWSCLLTIINIEEVIEKIYLYWKTGKLKYTTITPDMLRTICRYTLGSDLRVSLVFEMIHDDILSQFNYINNPDMNDDDTEYIMGNEDIISSYLNSTFELYDIDYNIVLKTISPEIKEVIKEICEGAIVNEHEVDYQYCICINLAALLEKWGE